MQNSICLYFGSWNFNNRKQTVYNTNGFLNRKYHCNEIFGASKNSLTLWNLNVQNMTIHMNLLLFTLTKNALKIKG